MKRSWCLLLVVASLFGSAYGGTITAYYVYDSATVNGVVMTNTAARLAEAYTATCSSCTKVTDLGFSYDVLGNVTAVYQLSPHSSTYFVTTATYYMANL